MLAAAALVLAIHATAQGAPPLNSAAALGQQLYQQAGSTGMVLLVIRGNELFFQGYGETAPGSGRTPDADSLLRLCSLSKIFASDLFVKLAIEHRVRVEDPLQRFAPPHAHVPARGGHPITLGDLLTHTAGLPREVLPAPAHRPHFTFPSFQQRWEWLPRQQLKSVPGTAALYSNVSFDLLGDALASAAQTPYRTLLAQRTLLPLGMHESGFNPTEAQCARLLQGSHNEGPCTGTEETAASSGLYSTARDVSQWMKYLLGTGAPAIPAQPGPAESAYIYPERLLRVEGLDHAGAPSGIGLGWIHTQPLGSEGEIIEKTGGGAGFTTYIAIDQPRHTGIFVAATEGTRPQVNLFKAANDVLLALAGLPPLPPEQPRPTVLRKRSMQKHRAAKYRKR